MDPKSVEHLSGGPAFPQRAEAKDANGYVIEQADVNGMTLRDYFAAKALAAMIGQLHKEGRHCGSNGVPLLAKYAYEYADAMLKARDHG